MNIQEKLEELKQDVDETFKSLTEGKKIIFFEEELTFDNSDDFENQDFRTYSYYTGKNFNIKLGYILSINESDIYIANEDDIECQEWIKFSSITSIEEKIDIITLIQNTIK